VVVRKIGAYIAIAALAAAVFSPTSAAAFVLRIGPYHISVPFYWRRHHHPPYAPGGATPPESTQGVSSALLYPQFALPAIFATIFSPAVASWPFDYRSILWAAFAAAPAQQNTQICRQQPDLASVIVADLRSALEPTAEQMPLLQNLGGALGAASGYLAPSCANEIPPQPIARLQHMASQIKELATALDVIRQPLQDFQQSLNDEQRARFAVMIAASAAAGRGCGGTATALDWSIEQIDRSVQPTDAQRDALNDVKQAFAKAASDLEAQCLVPMPPTAPSRLEAIEARLDATQRAVASIQTALANFETKLSDEQKSRLDAMHFAAQ